MYVRVLASVLSLLIYSGIAQAAPFAYIANNNDNTVTVLDTADNSVVNTITVGSHPYGVAVNRMGSRVYVSNEAAPYSVSVIDTFTNTVTGTISLTLKPGALAVNSAGTRLFIAHPDDASLSIYDTVTLAQVGTTMDLDAAAPLCSQPKGIVAGPADGSGNYKVYLSCFGSSSVGIIDATTSTYTKSSSYVNLTNINPEGITTSKDGKRVYVAGESSVALINATGAISSIPTATYENATNLSFAAGITADPSVADSANATKLYVASSANNKIAVLTATGDTLAFVTTIPAANKPWGIAFTADGAKAIVSNEYSGNPGSASVITKTSDSLTTLTATMGSAPKSFGKFAGPNFQTIYTAVNGNPNCGAVTTQELLTSAQGSGYYNDYLVAYGEPITFSITKAAECSITTVTVNGANQSGPPTNYTFAGPTADQTLDVLFTRNQWNLITTPSETNSGTGTFKINGATCGASCSQLINTNATVTVTAVADSNSTFNGWGGAGCSGDYPDCVKTLNSTYTTAFADDTGSLTITATFSKNLSGPVRAGRGGTVVYSSTLQEAYGKITSSAVLDINTSLNASSPLSANRNVAVTLIGGWSDWTTAPSGAITSTASNITGGLVVQYGSVTIGSYNNLGSIVIK